MLILIDTSIWVEYFKRTTKINCDLIDGFIMEQSIGTCLPIKAEVLSGNMNNNTRTKIKDAFDAMTGCDPDWTSDNVWEQIISLSNFARSYKIGLPGVVDRMIIISAMFKNAKIWTLDKKLNQFSEKLNIRYLFSIS